MKRSQLQTERGLVELRACNNAPGNRMSSEQAICHHRATCPAGFKQCQAQVTAPSPIEGRADLSSRSMTWSLSVATLRPPALANPFGLKTSGSTAASPNSARLIRALAWKGLSQSCGSLAPDPHLKINGAEQIDRSLVAAAHAQFPNLVEANKLRRRSAASALHSLLDLVGSPLSAN